MRLPELFRDSRFVVLDKPPGLKVHPGPAGGPSVEDAFPALRRGKDGPWLAHRLDADTAGCLVIALKKSALLAAQGAFAAHRAEKTYWAIVQGRPEANSGRLDAPLLKVTTGRAWRMTVDPAGAQAATRWRILGSTGAHTWLELHPETGRTHQVRAHCAALGCPILGDPIYGTALKDTPPSPLHLLARAIHLPLDPPLTAEAPPPPHMRAALTACGWSAP